jgi:hypothetical protein
VLHRSSSPKALDLLANLKGVCWKCSRDCFLRPKITCFSSQVASITGKRSQRHALRALADHNRDPNREGRSGPCTLPAMISDKETWACSRKKRQEIFTRDWPALSFSLFSLRPPYRIDPSVYQICGLQEHHRRSNCPSLSFTTDEERADCQLENGTPLRGYRLKLIPHLRFSKLDSNSPRVCHLRHVVSDPVGLWSALKTCPLHPTRVFGDTSD